MKKMGQMKNMKMEMEIDREDDDKIGKMKDHKEHMKEMGKMLERTIRKVIGRKGK